MEKMNRNVEKVNMEPEKYRFLFGFDNLVTVFHPCDGMNVTQNSEDYRAAYSFEHTCSFVEDVLKDMEVLIRTGSGRIAVNDVTGIKINGSVYCFRYPGVSSFLSGCHEVAGFVDREKDSLVREIHGNNKVLSILHGETLPIENIDMEKNVFYAIDGEMFKAAGNQRRGFSTTDYSLYRLNADNMEISKVNPHHKPFFNISVALYYFLHSKDYKNKKADPILLLNRKELEMLKDYYQLNRLIG